MKDRIASLVLFLLVIAVLVLTREFPVNAQTDDPGVVAWPRILVVVIAINAVVPMVFPEPGERLPTGRSLLRVCLTLATLGAYIFTLQIVGFFFATAGYLIAQFVVLNVRSVWTYIFIPVPLSLGLLIMFREMLEVSLPLSGIGGLPI